MARPWWCTPLQHSRARGKRISEFKFNLVNSSRTANTQRNPVWKKKQNKTNQTTTNKYSGILGRGRQEHQLEVNQDNSKTLSKNKQGWRDGLAFKSRHTPAGDPVQLSASSSRIRRQLP